MTTEEKLAEVTAQIRKDIPRTIELREGCYVKEKITNYLYKIYSVTDNCYNLYRVSDNDKWDVRKETYDKFKPFEIIGHDIMINDVLEWLKTEIDNREFIYSINSKGIFNASSGINDIYVVEDISWNLPSPYLKDQSEELIKFLYNLVKE